MKITRLTFPICVLNTICWGWNVNLLIFIQQLWFTYCCDYAIFWRQSKPFVSPCARIKPSLGKTIEQLLYEYSVQWTQLIKSSRYIKIMKNKKIKTHVKIISTLPSNLYVPSSCADHATIVQKDVGHLTLQPTLAFIDYAGCRLLWTHGEQPASPKCKPGFWSLRADSWFLQCSFQGHAWLQGP